MYPISSFTPYESPDWRSLGDTHTLAPPIFSPPISFSIPFPLFTSSRYKKWQRHRVTPHLNPSATYAEGTGNLIWNTTSPATQASGKTSAANVASISTF